MKNVGVAWTDDQKKAIDKRDCNVIVAAAAGSGKTAVLVERIVNIVESGVDIDSLLVTTFTDAAAKKMKQEIGDEIKKRLEENGENMHLARQNVLLSRADICTIDSFCMRVVRSNFHKTDVDPDFKIADQNECELLLTQAAQEVFGEMYESGNEGFYNLLEYYASQRGDEAFADVVLSLCRFISSVPDYRKWLDECVKKYTEFDNVFDSEWGEVVFEKSLVLLDGCIKRIKEAYEYASATDEMCSYAVPLQNDAVALDKIKAALLERDFDGAARDISSFKCEGGGRAKPKTPDEIKLPVTEARKYVDSHIGKLFENFFYDTQENIIAETEYAASHVKALCELTALVKERFFEIKKKRGVLDFSDIEHLALEILTDKDETGNEKPSDVALLLKEKYHMILVDEYQDSNELQELIFEKISRGDNIFMVGDIKQSIYRFRHTNPLLFKRKKDTYSDDGGINQRVIMSKNFRSREAVIDAVNYIMKQISSPYVGEMIYDETEALNCGAQYPSSEKSGGVVEVHVVGVDSEDDGENLVGAEAEAIRVAKRILQLKREGYEVYDKKIGGLRKMKYSDIAILMHSPGVDAPLFSDVLSRYGVPVFSDVDKGYLVNEHVEIVLSLLSVIDNPEQDIKLLAIMRSPIFGFSDTELVDIRLCDRKSNIFGALLECAKKDDVLGIKCRELSQKIDKWRLAAKHMSVHELIWYLYDETGYYDIVDAIDNSGKGKANLNLLIEYARSYEKTSFKGLFNFINYAERIKNASRDIGGAKILGENQDVVRIMSMHKSKGLEFAVVFVVRIAKKFNVMDLNRRVLVHPEMGMGVDFIDTKRCYKYPTFIKKAIKEKLYNENLSEEMRVLYVALTRAKEKLIITIAPPKPDSAKKKWLMGAKGASGDELAVSYTSEVNTVADWVMGAVMRHECARKYANEYISCPALDADIELYIADDNEQENEEFEVTLPKTASGECYKDLIEKRLGYVYQNVAALKIPTKVSVTEMKRIVNNEIDIEQVNMYDTTLVEKPAFMSGEKEMSAAEKGSAMHFVMQNIDLSKGLDSEGINKQIEGMLEDKIISKRQRECVSAEKIVRFFESKIGKRVAESGFVERELPFEIAVDASYMDIEGGEGETVLLQGIIDLYFVENDGVVLLDYKTDSVKSEKDIEIIAQKYRMQIELYAKALEEITKKRVKEKYLYLFSAESVVEY